MISESEKQRVAYALNLWTISVSQIIDYNDVNVMQQEYDAIMNNLNLENMPKDETLLDIIKEIMDEVTYFLIESEDKKIIDREYQQRMKEAVWSSVPNVGAIFATANPVALGITLATQVGIGYMNYRRNKAEYNRSYENSKWQIQQNRMQHLNGLQKQLFETAWRLADKYEFPDEYRLTAKQISDYNAALMEPNPVSRYISLDTMRSAFQAYPTFWYQIGSTANTIYRDETIDEELRAGYKDRAIECFETYRNLNKFNLLRHDVLTSSWALEYLELLGLNRDNNPDQAAELIGIAEKYSGNSHDVLELCAFEYLRLQDFDNAVRIFRSLVNQHYNAVVNTQILSSLYIRLMQDQNPELEHKAYLGYKELPEITKPLYDQYILELPSAGTDLQQWKPEWFKGEDPVVVYDREKEEAEASKNARMQARVFYQKPILLVHDITLENVAEYFLGLMDDTINQIDPSLPSTSKCTLRSYKSRREELERSGTRIILLGDSDEAKKLYRNTQESTWDYDELGMRYVSYGNKTVLMVRPLKNKELSDFILLAEEINKKYSVRIPSGVETVESTFLRNIFTGFDFSNQSKAVSSVAEIIAETPSRLISKTRQNISNGIQSIQNLASSKKLKFLQYCIAIYKYLESQHALVISESQHI